MSAEISYVQLKVANEARALVSVVVHIFLVMQAVSFAGGGKM